MAEPWEEMPKLIDEGLILLGLQIALSLLHFNLLVQSKNDRQEILHKEGKISMLDVLLCYLNQEGSTIMGVC